MVRHARIIALAVGLVGISALALTTRLHAQQTLDELRALAEQGDVNAQFNLGVRYGDGRGVSQDDAEEVRWYRLAADQGHAGAQHRTARSQRPSPSPAPTVPTAPTVNGAMTALDNRPLRKSQPKATNAQERPSARPTFVAPMFPLPTARTSTPLRRPSRNPQGTEPRR